MAAAFIGGALLSSFLPLLFERLAPRATIWDFFKGRNSNTKKLLEKLETTLIAMGKVLDDAEVKEIADPNVKAWLDKAKDVVFDADDLLDVIAYESHGKADDSRSSVGWARRCLASTDLSGKKTKFGEKLEEILERLVGLMEVKQHLGLVENTGQGFPHLPLERQTTSLVDVSEVHGREADKEAITTLLKTDSDQLGVIAIVGMGGLGKTTLAQIVYEHFKERDQFQLKAWVCISEETDVFFVTKNILKEFGSAVSDLESMTPNRLQNELKDTLMGKRFLLVLDDIWDERPERWDMLLKPLKHGLEGSWIIVTTRSNIVASQVSTVPAYSLKVLNEDECWLVFARSAFKDEDQSAHPELVATGRKIVAKCGGLPLAANALGSLLSTTRNSTEWELIMANDLWNLEDCRILPALRLSYHYLPSNHKRCFAYCALFPKDYEFEIDELVRLWMADGILDSHEGKRPMEDIGHEFFSALLSRSFFQKSSVNTSCFVMHDLIHDLAKSVAGDFYYRLEGDNPPSPPRKPRHLSYLSVEYNTSQKFRGIYRNQSLRSFLPTRPSGGARSQYINRDIVRHLFGASKRLRILSLSNYINIKKIPESVGKLKLLRYLDLSGTSIRRLPNVICTLWNLETLLLQYCKNLEEVPDSIVDLKYLHFLNLAGTAINKLPTNLCKLVKLCFLDISGTKLQEMPPRLGNLTRLQKLTDFFVGEGTSCSSIKELKELSRLKGKLRIWNLENVQNAQVASGSHLKGKKHLRDLELSWKGGDADDSGQELKVLEGLEPPCTLKHLTIRGYRGTKFPEWVGHHSISNLVSMRITGCKICHGMPPLGQVQSLKEFYIYGCEGIVVIDDSFYGSLVPATDKPFKSLEVLHFGEMSEWTTWEQHDGAFPSLRELYLSECPKLANALPGELPSLQKLVIRGCNQLVTPLPSAPSIVEVRLEDQNGTVNLDLQSGLQLSRYYKSSSLDQILGDIRQMGASVCDVKKVEIGYSDLASGYGGSKSCSPMEGVLKHFKCLDSLTIRRFPRVVSFPKSELASPSLTKLELHFLPNLESLPEQMKSILPCLMDLKLMGCPELESFPEGGLPSKLESLEIEGCKKLVAGRKQWNLYALPSLSSLAIGDDDEMESFPEEMLLPPTLATLVIRSFDGLKRLDYKGLEHLTSLQKLKIQWCSSLEKLAEEEEGLLPQSVTTLEISWLPKLKSVRPIQRLTCLTSLSIYRCNEIPEVAPLPSTVTSLTVYGMKKMKSLDGWGLQRLACLEKLVISNCKNLESVITSTTTREKGEEEALLPSSLREVQLMICPRLKSIIRGEAFPSTSLEALYIRNCPLLAEKCRWEGVDCHRISHIPNIVIH